MFVLTIDSGRGERKSPVAIQDVAQSLLFSVFSVSLEIRLIN